MANPSAGRGSYFFLLIGILLPVYSAMAIERIQISLGDIQGADIPGVDIQRSAWAAHDVLAEISLEDDKPGTLRLTAASLQLPTPVGVIRAPSIVCENFHSTPGLLECVQGSLRGATKLLGILNGSLKFSYRPQSGVLDFSVHGLLLAGGSLSLKGRLEGSEWSLSLKGKGLELDAILQLAQSLGYKTDYQSSGTVDLEIHSRGRSDQPNSIHLSAKFSNVDFNDALGIHAGEDLTAELSAEIKRSGKGWSVHAQLTGEQGQLYIDPLFLEVQDQPVVLDVVTRWAPGQDRLEIKSFQWKHPGVVESAGTLQIKLEPEFSLTGFDVQIRNGKLAGFYDTYVKPWLLGTMGGDLDASGELTGQLRYRDESLESLALQLDGVSIEDELGRVQLEGLQGSIDWAADQAERHSTLSWQQARLFKVDIGSARLPIKSRGFAFELAEQVRIPVLDGALKINEWQLQNSGSAGMRWNFDGVLTPISMEALTTALEWPTLSGKLSGMIPQVSYDHGELKVGGVLLVRAFDGEITVSNLVLSQPFSVVPRLQADIEVKALDLETLTRTFSFGKIEGRLGGHVRALRLEQWQPVAFEAELITPDGDKSRRRISQRALDNLSSIGGGVGGALSRSFLQMFEDFPYRRLGIRCRLQAGVCKMDGAVPAPSGGYYIVQGSFLPPRVDVIGFSDKVDWNTLVQQLVEATTGEGTPTIQ